MMDEAWKKVEEEFKNSVGLVTIGDINHEWYEGLRRAIFFWGEARGNASRAELSMQPQYLTEEESAAIDKSLKDGTARAKFIKQQEYED